MKDKDSYSGIKGSLSKSGFFSGFREYFLIGVSYVPDFFIAVKNYVGRTF